MKHLFIVNPTAGGKDRTEEVRAEAERVFATREESFEVYITKAPLDATAEIIKRAETGEEYRIYSCGGDGTFNECAGGAAGHDNIAVAPYPVGTGNDFCRMFGDEAPLFRNLEALVNGSVRKIDAIDVNGRISVNLCSVGIDARIGCNVHKYSSLPIIGGSAAYVVSAVVEMFKGIPMYMKIKSDNYESEGMKTLACVCNGRYYGGGFNPCAYAAPDDGVLDIYIADKLNIFQFAGLIGKYSKGKGDGLKFIDVLHAQEISFEFDSEQIINVDGEAIWAKKVDMKLVPHCVGLIIPEGLKFFED